MSRANKLRSVGTRFFGANRTAVPRGGGISAKRACTLAIKKYKKNSNGTNRAAVESALKTLASLDPQTAKRMRAEFEAQS